MCECVCECVCVTLSVWLVLQEVVVRGNAEIERLQDELDDITRR